MVTERSHEDSSFFVFFFFFSSRRRHTRCLSDWSSDVCSSDLIQEARKSCVPDLCCFDFRACHFHPLLFRDSFRIGCMTFATGPSLQVAEGERAPSGRLVGSAGWRSEAAAT